MSGPSSQPTQSAQPMYNLPLQSSQANGNVQGLRSEVFKWKGNACIIPGKLKETSRNYQTRETGATFETLISQNSEVLGQEENNITDGAVGGGSGRGVHVIGANARLKGKGRGSKTVGVMGRGNGRGRGHGI